MYKYQYSTCINKCICACVRARACMVSNDDGTLNALQHSAVKIRPSQFLHIKIVRLFTWTRGTHNGRHFSPSFSPIFLPVFLKKLTSGRRSQSALQNRLGVRTASMRMKNTRAQRRKKAAFRINDLWRRDADENTAVN